MWSVLITIGKTRHMLQNVQPTRTLPSNLVMNALAVWLLLTFATTWTSADEGKRVLLSRKRRFFIPKTTGWSFVAEFKVNIPLELTSSSKVEIKLPVTYKVDDGT